MRLTIEDEDRISSLPDHILHCILCKLEAKHAAQTCILSKRWLYVGKKLHILKFRYPNHQLENNPEDTTSSFTKSESRFLNNCDAFTDIRTLQFVAPYSVDLKCLKKFIRYAFRHNVKFFSMTSLYTNVSLTAIQENIERLKTVAASGFKPIRLSRYFSDCQSLKWLKLDSFNCSIRLPESLNLPALEVIQLEWFSLSKSNQYTFSSCPNLRHLYLYYCTIPNNLEVLNICGPKLQNIKFLYLHRLRYLSPSNIKVAIDAPSLVSFSFRGSNPMDFVMGELPCLDVFRIELNVQFHRDIYKRGFVLLLIKMLRQLCNAKSARLSLRTLEVLSISSPIHIFKSFDLDHFRTLSAKFWQLCFNSITKCLRITVCGIPLSSSNQVVRHG